MESETELSSIFLRVTESYQRPYSVVAMFLLVHVLMLAIINGHLYTHFIFETRESYKHDKSQRD